MNISSWGGTRICHGTLFAAASRVAIGCADDRGDPEALSTDGGSSGDSDGTAGDQLHPDDDSDGDDAMTDVRCHDHPIRRTRLPRDVGGHPPRIVQSGDRRDLGVGPRVRSRGDFNSQAYPLSERISVPKPPADYGGMLADRRYWCV